MGLTYTTRKVEIIKVKFNDGDCSQNKFLIEYNVSFGKIEVSCVSGEKQKIKIYFTGQTHDYFQSNSIDINYGFVTVFCVRNVEIV